MLKVSSRLRVLGVRFLWRSLALGSVIVNCSKSELELLDEVENWLRIAVSVLSALR